MPDFLEIIREVTDDGEYTKPFHRARTAKTQGHLIPCPFRGGTKRNERNAALEIGLSLCYNKQKFPLGYPQEIYYDSYKTASWVEHMEYLRCKHKRRAYNAVCGRNGQGGTS